MNDDRALLSSNSGSFSARITAHTDPDDALDGNSATKAFGGSATIIRLASGVKTTIKAAKAATASVDTGFARFAGNAGQAGLGWLGIEEKIAADGASIVYTAAGEELEDDDIIAAGGKISFNVKGNLDIGAFSTVKQQANFDLASPTTNLTGCNANLAETVDRGTFVDDKGKKLIGEKGERPSGVESASTGLLEEGLYLVCVNVDVTGPETNTIAIPKAEYTATAHLKRNAEARLQMVGEEGDVGSIVRDGASVNISYLTTSEQHNQRLIIVNRGNRPIVITDIAFQTEGKTEAHLSEALSDLDEIESGVTVMHKVSDILSITGGSRRTAATLSFNGVAGNISVATTQVNLGDSSTDTVVWPVE